MNVDIGSIRDKGTGDQGLLRSLLDSLKVGDFLFGGCNVMNKNVICTYKTDLLQ